jgi:hypothetical protein
LAVIRLVDGSCSTSPGPQNGKPAARCVCTGPRVRIQSVLPGCLSHLGQAPDVISITAHCIFSSIIPPAPTVRKIAPLDDKQEPVPPPARCVQPPWSHREGQVGALARGENKLSPAVFWQTRSQDGALIDSLAAVGPTKGVTRPRLDCHLGAGHGAIRLPRCSYHLGLSRGALARWLTSFTVPIAHFRRDNTAKTVS